MSEAVYKVFVYGTLKPGGHYWPQFCEGKVSEVLPAKVQGKLYDLHVGYPGVRLVAQHGYRAIYSVFPAKPISCN